MKQPIATVPKDRAILLHFPDRVITHPKLSPYTIKGGWIEATWDPARDWEVGSDVGIAGYVGGWDVLCLPVHGCGCCTSSNQNPDFWMELPDAL